MCRVLRSVKCSICWRQETPATLTIVSVRRWPRPPGRGGLRRSCARSRSARPRSRMSRPCRSSRRRSPWRRSRRSPGSPARGRRRSGPSGGSGRGRGRPGRRSSFQTMPRSPAASSLARNSSIMKDSRATASTSGSSGRRSRYSSRRVRMQLGSVPMMGMPGAGVGGEELDVAAGQLAGVFDEALGEHRAAAAGAALFDDDLEAGGLQQFHRGHADARVVVGRRRCRGSRRPCRASGAAVAAMSLLVARASGRVKVRNGEGRELALRGDAEGVHHGPVETEPHAEVDERGDAARRGGRGRGCGRRRGRASACRARRGSGPGTRS